ncbi:MAG: hypothetical protein GY866_15650 [Proteobacteria bacterium]|nr:hypothetical protein [Pseudomonadota bacterium]
MESPRGDAELKAKVSDIVLPGVVHMPHHWPEKANADLLVDDVNLDPIANLLVEDVNLDPISGFAPYKSQLCRVTKSED